MKEYICKEVQTDNGGYLEIEKELIRCEDCDNCTRTELYDGQRWYYCMRNRCVVKDDDFCSYAEPKVTE